MRCRNRGQRAGYNRAVKIARVMMFLVVAFGFGILAATVHIAGGNFFVVVGTCIAGGLLAGIWLEGWPE